MKFHKMFFNVIVGMAFIIFGVWLSIDLILKFAKAAAGILLVMVGIAFLMRRN